MPWIPVTVESPEQLDREKRYRITLPGTRGSTEILYREGRWGRAGAYGPEPGEIVTLINWGCPIEEYGPEPEFAVDAPYPHGLQSIAYRTPNGMLVHLPSTWPFENVIVFENREGWEIHPHETERLSAPNTEEERR